MDCVCVCLGSIFYYIRRHLPQWSCSMRANSEYHQPVWWLWSCPAAMTCSPHWHCRSWLCWDPSSRFSRGDLSSIGVSSLKSITNRQKENYFCTGISGFNSSNIQAEYIKQGWMKNKSWESPFCEKANCNCQWCRNSKKLSSILVGVEEYFTEYLCKLSCRIGALSNFSSATSKTATFVNLERMERQKWICIRSIRWELDTR